MKIYTKTGDKGETSLWGGKRVRKNNKIIEAIGSIDELIAWLGLLKLTKIQNDLMVINSSLAGVRGKGLGARVEELEKEIDQMQKKLPVLTNFILPQNNIHIVRAVCRRAERRITGIQVDRNIGKYVNRLSDYLFVLARWTDWKKGKKELIWKDEGRGLSQKISGRTKA